MEGGVWAGSINRIDSSALGSINRIDSSTPGSINRIDSSAQTLLMIDLFKLLLLMVPILDGNSEHGKHA